MLGSLAQAWAQKEEQKQVKLITWSGQCEPDGPAVWHLNAQKQIETERLRMFCFCLSLHISIFLASDISRRCNITFNPTSFYNLRNVVLTCMILQKCMMRKLRKISLRSLSSSKACMTYWGARRWQPQRVTGVHCLWYIVSSIF